MIDTCVFCDRTVETCRHHLIPKSKGGRVTVPACKDCETFIHRTLTHAQLRDSFPTVESIRRFEPYQAFLAWLRKQQPDARFPSARQRPSRRRRNKPAKVRRTAQG